MDVRKEQSQLTGVERAAFTAALLTLKTATPSQLGLQSRYDDYVQIHMDSMMMPDGSDRIPGWAHRGPAFGPWHRALLRNLEMDLKKAAGDPALTLPYWDWSVHQSSSGAPWTDSFMGKVDPATDVVTTGPFRQGVWKLTIMEQPGGDTFLRRALGRPQFQDPQARVDTLPTPANVSGTLAETPYDRAPWKAGDNPSFRDRLEGWHGPGSIHNRVHLWVGGSMLPSTSPNDPVFFLHHCNVDRLWAQWQRQHKTEAYVPGASASAALAGHRLKDPMQPWGGAVTVESTLDHHALGYRYDDEPVPPSVFADKLHAEFPAWQHKPSGHRHMRMAPMVMFDLSPEDKAAGGHNRGM